MVPAWWNFYESPDPNHSARTLVLQHCRFYCLFAFGYIPTRDGRRAPTTPVQCDFKLFKNLLKSANQKKNKSNICNLVATLKGIYQQFKWLFIVFLICVSCLISRLGPQEWRVSRIGERRGRSVGRMNSDEKLWSPQIRPQLKWRDSSLVTLESEVPGHTRRRTSTSVWISKVLRLILNLRASFGAKWFTKLKANRVYRKCICQL